MKYIDADLLKKDIKRLEKAAHKSALGCADSEKRKFLEGKDFAYQHVGILLDSLLPEQPVDIPSAGSGAMGTTPPKFKLEVKEQLEGLENEIFRYYYANLGMIISPRDTKDIVANIARHFAEWGAKHLK